MKRVSKMCRRNAKKGRQNNGGFTTVELIVVIVLIMLLGGGLVFGVTKWVEWSKFNRQNESARTLFAAVQNQLTEYSESGQLEELQAQMQGAGGSYMGTIDDLVAGGSLIAADGTAYTPETLWPESADKANPSKYRGPICSVTATKADYRAYRNGTADARITALYDMLTPYLYDSSILNAAVCVEFTPEDGQVFAVFYSDVDENFTYEDTAEVRGTVSILNREAKERKKRMVGYYGVDSLYRSTRGAAPEPVMSECMLVNEETLNLCFGVEEGAEPTELNYEVTVYDQAEQEPVLKFVLDGSEIKTEAFRQRIPCEVKRYRYDAEGKAVTQTLGEYPFLTWLDKDGNVRIVLDAADLGATTAEYKSVYKTLTTKDAADYDFGWQTDKIRNTLSFLRFGVNVEEIYCTVEGAGAAVQTMAKKTSNVEHTLFGSVQMKEEGEHTAAVYAIRNARHLYNMRYLEDYTDGERYDMGYEKTAEQVSYRLEQNVSWSGMAEGGAVFGNEVESPENAAFPSLKQLRSESVLESSGTENIYTISGLRIRTEDTEKAGIYADVTDWFGRPTGLAAVNYGTMQNLKLDKVQVSGKDYVGAFCGISSGTLRNLTVENTGAQSRITGKSLTGGIVGTNGDTAEKLLFENLENHAEVREEGYWEQSGFGGIAGSIVAKKQQKILVKNCLNYGRITLKDTQDGAISNIGGIAGSSQVEGVSASLTITDCLGAPQYTKDEVAEIESGSTRTGEWLAGMNVGGIVGYNRGAEILRCSTGPEEGKGYREGYILGGENVGGIVGDNAGDGQRVVLDGTDNGRNSVNTATVIGKRRVGGIIGVNRENATVKNWVNRGNVKALESYAGGITGQNCGEIAACENAGNVAAKNGLAGGICAENGIEYKDNKNVLIRDCTVEPGGAGGTLTLESREKAGGITAVNRGNVDDSGVKALNIVCSAAGQESIIGGIAGENAGVILNSTVGEKAARMQLRPQTQRAQIGGVAGVNRGVIQGGSASGSYSRVYADLSLAGVGNIGGIVGRNERTIYGYVFSGEVKGEGNQAEYGCGGIAGINRTREGTITDCMVANARISGSGSTDNIAYVGGAAGKNEAEAVISGLTFGSPDEGDASYTPHMNSSLGLFTSKNTASVYVGTAVSGAASNYGYVGGAAGLNAGKIMDIRAGRQSAGGDYRAEADLARVIVETNAGNAGGIAGYNQRGGTLERVETGRNWIVAAIRHAEDTGCGGIVGRQAGESGIDGAVNRASVEKSADGSSAVGGVIGLMKADQPWNGYTIAKCSNYGNVCARNGAGGIVGRMEADGYMTYKISECNNYGKIQAGSDAVGRAGGGSAGGIVGVWMDRSGQMTDCINYGAVNAYEYGAAGMVGRIGSPAYAYDSYKVTVQNCQNHGQIQTGKLEEIEDDDTSQIVKESIECGGILGAASEPDTGAAFNVIAEISNCVNTGLISPGNENGGILGIMRNLSQDSTITDCVNYGYGYKSTKLGGIVPFKFKLKIKLKNCFGIAATKYPVGKNGPISIEKCYYLGSEAIGSASGTELSVEPYNTGGYYLKDKKEVIGHPGFPIDPMQAFAEAGEALMTDNRLKAAGQAEDNIRYQVFEADQKYFTVNAGKYSLPASEEALTEEALTEETLAEEALAEEEPEEENAEAGKEAEKYEGGASGDDTSGDETSEDGASGDGMPGDGAPENGVTESGDAAETEGEGGTGTEGGTGVGAEAENESETRARAGVGILPETETRSESRTGTENGSGISSGDEKEDEGKSGLPDEMENGQT